MSGKRGGRAPSNLSVLNLSRRNALALTFMAICSSAMQPLRALADSPVSNVTTTGNYTVYSMSDPEGTKVGRNTLADAMSEAESMSQSGNVGLQVNVDDTTMTTTIEIRLSAGSTLTFHGVSGKKPIIKRGGSFNSLFILHSGELIIKNLIFDGQKALYTSVFGGGVFQVHAGAKLIASAGTVMQNCKAPDPYMGGAVYLSNGSSSSRAEFVMEDGAEAHGCEAKYGGFLKLGLFARATIMGGTRIADCHAYVSGGAIRLDDGGDEKSFPMLEVKDSVTFENCRANNYGGCISAKGPKAVVHLTGNVGTSGIVVGRCKSAHGGAVHVNSEDAQGGKRVEFVAKGNVRFEECEGTEGGVFYQDYRTDVTLSDGVVMDGCTAKNGGGVFMVKGGGSNSRPTLTLSGSVTVKNCSATEYGGFIYTAGDTARITLSGAPGTDGIVIDNCRASLWGGAFDFNNGDANSYALLTMKGKVTIKNCKANNGGVASLENFARIDGSDPNGEITIEGNEATKLGGAFYLRRKDDVSTHERFLVFGGKFSATGNRAEYGAFHYDDANSVLMLQDEASITKNNTTQSTGQSGVIHLNQKWSRVYVKGKPVVKDNVGNNIYIHDDIYGEKLRVIGNLTGEKDSICLYTSKYQANERFALTFEVDDIWPISGGERTAAPHSWSGYERVLHNDRNTSLRAYEVGGTSDVVWKSGKPLCKVIDKDGNPHPFVAIREAIKCAKAIGGAGDYKSKNDDGTMDSGVRIEMVAGVYKVTKCSSDADANNAIFEGIADRKVILTSAKTDAQEYPLTGGETDWDGITKAMIQRDCEGPLAAVTPVTPSPHGALLVMHSDVETRNIILDGNANSGASWEVRSDGNIAFVDKAHYHMQSGTTIRNAKGTEISSSAVYVRGSLGIARLYMYAGARAHHCAVGGGCNGGAFVQSGPSTTGNKSEIFIQGGEIDHCDATDAQYGGGAILGFMTAKVFIGGNAYIHHNKATMGSAVSHYDYSPSFVYIEGDNSSEGVRIVDNKCTVPGNGAVHVMSRESVPIRFLGLTVGLFNVQGKVNISNNKDGDGKDCGVLTGVTKIIKVTGDIHSDSKIGIWGFGVDNEKNYELNDQFAITANSSASAVQNLSAFKNERYAAEHGVSMDNTLVGVAGSDNKVIWGQTRMVPVKVKMHVNQAPPRDHWFVAQLRDTATNDAIRMSFMIPAGSVESEVQTVLLSPAGKYASGEVSSHDNWLYRIGHPTSDNDVVDESGTEPIYSINASATDHDLTFNADRNPDVHWERDLPWASNTLS